MSPSDREPDRDLESLFERTAKVPSEAARARLLSRASEIATQKRKPRWADPRLLWPGALAAAAAVAFLVLAPAHQPGAEHSGPAIASALDTATAPRAANESRPSATGAPTSTGEEVTADEPSDLVAAVFGETAEPDAFDLGPLMWDDAVNGASGTGM